MSSRLLYFGLTVMLVLLGCMVYMLRGSLDVSPKELAKRCARSAPAWQNYPEDIKAQIGATPVAQWHGELVSVSRANATIQIAFNVTGAWRHRAMAIPVLLREPHGGIHCSKQIRHLNEQTVYLFELPHEMRQAALTWLEVRFPHGTKRIVLASDGSWQSSP